MRTSEIAPLLGLKSSEEVLRVARRIGIDTAIGSGYRHTFSPGDVLAMMIMAALQADARCATVPETYAEGAAKCGEAIDNGYRPAYLVTRGGTENVVVLESEKPAQTDEMVAALLLQASDAGKAVRVVRLRKMIAQLEPWLSELVDA